MISPLLYIILQVSFVLPDGGPVYAETNVNNLVVEPWNAVSAFLFLFIVIYWLLRLKGNFSRHIFLSIVLPILTVGGIGGTIYHAFRMSKWFLMMDWLPIMIICFMASVYLLLKVVGKWRNVVLLLLAFIALEMLNFKITPPRFAVNISYIFLATLVLAPTFVALKITKYYAAKYVIYALLCFVAAISFRIIDHWGVLSMGTHFLWHTFGAGSCHFMLMYFYHAKEHQLSPFHQLGRFKDAGL